MIQLPTSNKIIILKALMKALVLGPKRSALPTRQIGENKKNPSNYEDLESFSNFLLSSPKTNGHFLLILPFKNSSTTSVLFLSISKGDIWPGLRSACEGLQLQWFALAWPQPRGLIKGINGVHYLSDS